MIEIREPFGRAWLPSRYCCPVAVEVAPFELSPPKSEYMKLYLSTTATILRSERFMCVRGEDTERAATETNEQHEKTNPQGGPHSGDGSGPSDRYERKLERMRQYGKEYRASGPRKASGRVTQKMRLQALEILRSRHWQEYEQILEGIKGKR